MLLLMRQQLLAKKKIKQEKVIRLCFDIEHPGQ